MGLTNQQYESIIKGYEQQQLQNRRIWQERRDKVSEQLPQYESLEDSVGTISLDYTRRILDGDDAALHELRQTLASISTQKEMLLSDAGYPNNFLDAIYHCVDCKDTGYIRDNQELLQKCHCFRQQEIALLYEQSNIQEMIQKENFSTLSYEYYSGDDLIKFQAAEEMSRNFVQDFKNNYSNIFFYGTVGTGKSFLSGCIAKELLQMGLSVIYFSSSGLFDTLARYTFDIKLKESLYNFYKDLYNCDLVIIDDLGTEVTNSFVTSQLFSCLNERHLRKKSTIISTNLSLEELRDRYSDRIFSRITSNFNICKLSGQDIRMYKKLMANRK